MEPDMAVKPLTAVGVSSVVITLLVCRLLPLKVREALSLTGLFLFFAAFVGALVYRYKYHYNHTYQKPRAPQ